MSGPVRVNSREVVTSRSGGVSFAFGDVCLLPEGGGPLPFVNVAVSADASNTARTVRVHGVPIMLARSTFARSTGDEPGKDGGVLSRTTQGAAVFSNYSFDVKIEGQQVPRAHDPMLHNLDAQGIPNAASPAELQLTGAVDPDFEAICVAICMCNAMGQKMTCLREMLATPIQEWIPTCDIDPDAPPGHKSCVRYWDPHIPPGFYVEPTYGMTPPPPRPMLSKGIYSKSMKDRRGNPLPLSGGDSPIVPGSRRPDVVVPLDPTEPPGPGNIKRIFEVKFPPDTPFPGQIRAYEKIAGTAPVDVVGPDECQCSGKRKPRRRDVPREVPFPVPVPVPISPRQEEEPEPVPEPFPIRDPGALGILAVLLGILWRAMPGIPVLPGMPVAPGGRPVFPGEEPPRET